MKISIYEINEEHKILNEEGEEIGTSTTPLPLPKLVTSLFVTKPTETTRTVDDGVDENGDPLTHEEKYTPELDVKYFFSDYNEKTMTYGDYGIENPIYDSETKLVRDMTRVEKIEKGREILKDGEKIVDNKVVYVAPNPNHIHSVWNGTEWVEGATEQEITDHQLAIKNKYFDLINQYKKIVMDIGIVWKGHKQKLRSDIDIPLITGSIMALERRIANGEENPVKVWSFSDNDNSVELHLDDFNEILTAADVLVDKCYSAERELKGRTPNLELTLEDFNSLII